jgi:hypothetical protein
VNVLTHVMAPKQSPVFKLLKADIKSDTPVTVARFVSVNTMAIFITIDMTGHLRHKLRTLNNIITEDWVKKQSRYTPWRRLGGDEV